MDKKKVIGIVVFIVLGLVIFTFANPAPSTLDPVDEPGQEDKQPDKDKQPEEGKEDEKDDSETVGNIEDDEEKDESVVDYYQLALEAVIKAEGSLVQDDIDAAKDLINNVNEDLKEDLVNRVENVQNVVDYNKLLTELENKTNSSTNKDELNSARDYNTTNELANKLASLNDDANKTNLLNRYNVLLPKLNDTTAPVVSGVLNDSYVNSLVSLTISDDASFIATLNDENYITGTEITEDGVYKLVAVDSSFNETVITFTIDTTAPVFTGIQNGHQYKEVTLGLTEKNIAEVVIYNRDLDKYYDFEEGMVLTDEGTYTAYAKDKAGNLSGAREDGIIYFAIDNTNPEVIDITQVYEEKEDGRIKVTIKTSEEIFGDLLGSSKWRKVEGKNEYFNYYYSTKEVTINFFDKAGNEGTYTFVVDKTAPTAEITMSNNNGNTSTNKDVTVTLNASEDILDIEGWTKVDSKTFTKVFSENGKYSVEITDLVGNKSTINFEVKRIDKVAPVITIEGESNYNIEVNTSYAEKGYSAYDVLDKDLTSRVVVTYQFLPLGSSNWEEVGSVDTSKLGTYEITYFVTDKAGNPAETTRIVNIIDSSKPEITVKDISVGNFEEKIFSSVSFKLKDSHLVSKVYLNGVEKKITPNSVSDFNYITVGKYGAVYGENELVIYDAYGNEAKYTFTLDNIAPELPYLTNNKITNESLNLKVVDDNFDYILITNNDTGYTWKEKRSWTGFSLEGNFTFIAYDKAGNSSQAYTVTIDTTPAGRVYSTLDFDGTGIVPEIDGTRKTYYVKNGSSFVFRIQFTEQLSENPILNVDNKQVELELVDKYVTEEGKYIYQGKVEINTDDNFKDGVLILILSNVKDLAGNETTSIEILDQTVTSNDRTAFVDNTAPEITIAGTEGLNKNEYRIESGTPITLEDMLAIASDASFAEDIKIEPKRVNFLAPGSVLEDNIYNYDYKTNGFDTRKVGRYDIYYQVTDKAGNISEEKLMMLVMTDTTAPVVTINGKTDTYVEFGSEYKELGATMTDNVDETITDLKPTKINLYDLNGKFIKDVTKTGVNANVEGKYLLYYDYVDGAGNSSKTDNGYTPYQAKRWVIVQDTKAPEITGVASNTTYFGSIDYNMSDDNGIKYIYYDFSHNYQSCEELINAYNNKVGGVGREDVKGLVNYAGNYPIPAGYAFKGVSYCAVDNGYYENKTFMNNISVYADTSADTVLKAVSENNGTIVLPKDQVITLNSDLVINANTTIVGNGATLVGKVIISGDNVVLKNIKLTDNLVVTGANAVLDGVTMLNVNSAGTGKGNGYQVIKVNTNGNFTMKNSIIDNTYSNGSFYNAINISAEGKVEIEDNKFINIENVYNIIEFSQSTPIASGTIIKGNEFIGKSKNNVISMFLFEDENVITIEDNYFEFSGNALRISNYSNAKNVVINVNGNKYNDTLDGEYAGFMFFQEVKNESFAGITINVTHLIGPDGVKITSETTGKYLFNYYYSDHQSLTKEDYATINFLD